MADIYTIPIHLSQFCLSRSTPSLKLRCAKGGLVHSSPLSVLERSGTPPRHPVGNHKGCPDVARGGAQFCLSRRMVYEAYTSFVNGGIASRSQFCLSRRVVYYAEKFYTAAGEMKSQFCLSRRLVYEIGCPTCLIAPPRSQFCLSRSTPSL